MREFKTDLTQNEKVSDGEVSAGYAFDAFDDFIIDEENFEANLPGFDAKDSDNIMCCCAKEKLHDESMKFILMHKPDQQDLVLFEDREAGNIIYLNDTREADQMSSIYDKTILIGRNFEIQKIVKQLTKEQGERVLQVNSDKGLGKKCVVIAAVKYCIERHFFKDGAFNIDIVESTSCHSFLNMVFKRFKLEIDNLDDLCQIIENLDMILIFNDCQEILADKREKAKFEGII